MGAMGCCVAKEEESYRYLYKNLNLYESDDLLRTKLVQCRFCKEYILHSHEQITACTQCGTVLGHYRCVSFYRMSHAACPACQKT